MKRKNSVNAFGNWHYGNRAREVDASVPQGEATFDISVSVVGVFFIKAIAIYIHNFKERILT